MLLSTAGKRKKQTNILSVKSNDTYDKKLAAAVWVNGILVRFRHELLI